MNILPKKSVASICSQFTGQLNAVMEASRAEASRQTDIITKARESRDVHVTEAIAASNAIDGIEKLFGVQ